MSPRMCTAPRTALRLPILLWMLTVPPAPAAAQSAETLRDALTPGRVVWLTALSGAEERTRIVAMNGDLVTAETRSGELRRMSIADLVRVRTARQDSLMNGAVIGAGAAVASGLFICRLTEPWEVCRNPKPLVGIGAIGAGIGIGIDALFRSKQTIYERGHEATLTVAPSIARRHAAVDVLLAF